MDRLVIRSSGEPEARKLARLVKSRAPDLKCGAGGGRDFGMVEEPDSNIRTHLRRYPAGGGLALQSTSQTLATLICTRCSHLEQFAEAVLNGARPEEYGPEVGDDR